MEGVFFLPQSRGFSGRVLSSWRLADRFGSFRYNEREEFGNDRNQVFR
jgi:hypothetical protein